MRRPSWPGTRHMRRLCPGLKQPGPQSVVSEKRGRRATAGCPAWCRLPPLGWSMTNTTTSVRRQRMHGSMREETSAACWCSVPMPRGLAGQMNCMHQRSNGHVEVRCNDHPLAFTLFDQRPHVNEGVVVEAKRLKAVLCSYSTVRIEP